MGSTCNCNKSEDGNADGLVFKTPRSNTDPKQQGASDQTTLLLPSTNNSPKIYGSPGLRPVGSDKIEVTADIMIAYILSLSTEQLQSAWQRVDFGQRNSITAKEQFRKLLVLMVDQYIDSQMNATTRNSHIVTTSLTMLKVDHSRGNTEDDANDDHQMQKPSVIFDCNEMVELEEMMGDMVKHARSAPVVDYLYDEFQNKLTAHGYAAKPYITKPFYLMYFQKYFKEIRDGDEPRRQSSQF